MYAGAREPGHNFKAHFGEAGRAEADLRIARKAEAFPWHTHESIEFPIGIRIMKDRQRIAAGRNSAEQHFTCCSGHGQRDRFGIALAVGKVGWVTRQAGVDHSALTAKSGQIDLQGRGRCLAAEERGKLESCKYGHCPIEYQAPAGPANPFSPARS